MNVAIIGAGNGGVAAAVELTLAGHAVTLCARSAATVRPYLDGGIAYSGVFGAGSVRPARMTCALADAIRDVDVVVVALPTFAHADIARQLAQAGWPSGGSIVLNPGHTGGALAFRSAYRLAGGGDITIAEFSTLAYIARKQGQHGVSITGRAHRLRAAALPGGEQALSAALTLFPGAFDSGDVLSADLANVNMVLHPPGAMLSAAWVEARGGDFTFYVDAMTPGVARVMRALDEERLAVARAFGHDLPVLIDEMKMLGTAASDADSDDYQYGVAQGEANRNIKAPDSLTHRYYLEDFNFGLVPFLALAEISGVGTPTAKALNALGQILIGETLQKRDAHAMGIAGFSRAQLLESVRR